MSMLASPSCFAMTEDMTTSEIIPVNNALFDLRIKIEKLSKTAHALRAGEEDILRLMLKGVMSEEMIEDVIWRVFTVAVPSTDVDHFERRVMGMMCIGLLGRISEVVSNETGSASDQNLVEVTSRITKDAGKYVAIQTEWLPVHLVKIFNLID